MSTKKSISVILIASFLFLYGGLFTFLELDNLKIGVHDRICTPLLGCHDIEKGILLQAFHLLLAILPLISAVGLLMRRSWGWWFTLTCLTYTIFYELIDFITHILLRDRSINSYQLTLIPYLMPLFLLFVILLYRQKILDIFSISYQNRILFIRLLGLSILILVVYELVVYVSTI